jgi:plastocyanin
MLFKWEHMNPRMWIVAGLAMGICLQPCASAPLMVEVRDDQGRPVTDAVVGVLLRGIRTSASPTASASIVQRQRQFQPPITAVQTGTSVQFPNFDTVRHHVFSFSPTKRFELKLYAGTPAAPVVFDKAGVAVLGCNIHDLMAAWVVVMDTPVIGKTDAAGLVSLDVPSGEHRLLAWRHSWGEVEAFAERSMQMPASGIRTTWTLGGRPP